MRLENPKRLLELLVRELRLWQELARLIRLERRLLIECDMLNLVDLGRRKGQLLSEIFTFQQSRRHVVESYLSEHPRGLHLDERERLSQLAAGIQVLASQVGELAQPNYSLADCAIKRMWAINGWRQQERLASLPALLATILDAREGSSVEALHPVPGEYPRSGLNFPELAIEQDFLTLINLELAALLG